MSTPLATPEAAPGKRGPYLTLSLVAASHSVNHMFAALMPIIYPPAMDFFGFSYAQLGIMVGIGNTIMSLMQGVFGFLTGKVLRRVLLGLGSILLAVSMSLMSLSGSFLPFFLLNILARVSGSPQHPVGNSLVAESFGKKLRGTAFAVNFAGGNAGTLLIPSLGTLALAYLGWRGVLQIFAVIPLIIGLLTIFLIPEVKKAQSGENREKGARSAGRAFLAPLKERNIFFVVLAATVAAGGRGIGVVMTYVPLYFQKGLNLNPVTYATLFTILMIGSVVGPLTIGKISDIIGRKRTVVTTYILSLLSMLALISVGHNVPLLILVAIFMGLVVYSQSSQIQAFLADVTRKEMRDMAYSVFFTISYLAGAVWAYGLGLSIDRFGFKGAFILMAISYLGGTLAILPARSRE